MSLYLLLAEKSRLDTIVNRAAEEQNREQEAGVSMFVSMAVVEKCHYLPPSHAFPVSQGTYSAV